MRVQRSEQHRRQQGDKTGQPRLSIAGIGRHECRTNAADPGSYQNSQEQGHRGASLTDKRQIPAGYRHIPRIYFTVGSTAGARLKNLGNGTAIQNQNSLTPSTPSIKSSSPPQRLLKPNAGRDGGRS